MGISIRRGKNNWRKFVMSPLFSYFFGKFIRKFFFDFTCELLLTKR